MKVIDRSNYGEDAVASWWMEVEANWALAHDEQALEKLLDTANEALEILAVHGIFEPARVEGDRWVDHAMRPPQPTVHPLSVALGSGDWRSWREKVRKEMELELGKPFRFPAKLLILGHTDIKLPDGSIQRLENAVWLELQATDVAVLNLNTDCDAWLPLGIEGEKQEELATLNAPRLEAALQAIRSQLHPEIITENSPYAVVNETSMENYPD